MRIDFVITELFVGGAERCLTELAMGLADRGDDVRVFSIGSLPRGEQSRLVLQLRDRGIEIESASADSPWQFVAAYRRLATWLSNSPPDVCQTFLFHANVLGTLAAQAADVPVRVGGLRVAEPKLIRCRVERHAVARMDRLVCVSESLQTFALERLACPLDRSIVIPNAVDVTQFADGDRFNWQRLGWPADAIVSLFVGRLHPQKGIDLLRENIDAIAPAGSPRKLLLVGDGPQSEVIDRWVERVGVDRVRRLAWQSDVGQMMRSCRVLVLPSRYEGMPNVVMEAMAAGRPVVCSRIEGSRELFSHDATNQTFDVGDGQTMASLIDTFTSSEKVADRVGRQNQQRMRKDFSISAMVDSYRRLYCDLRTRRLEV